MKKHRGLCSAFLAAVMYCGGMSVGKASGLYAESSNPKGYFAYWNTKADGSGDTYFEGDSVPKYEDMDLYGQWVVADAGTGKTSNNLVETARSKGIVKINDSAVSTSDGKKLLGWTSPMKDKLSETAQAGTPSNSNLFAMTNINLSKKAAAANGDGTLGTYTGVYVRDDVVANVYTGTQSGNSVSFSVPIDSPFIFSYHDVHSNMGASMINAGGYMYDQSMQATHNSGNITVSGNSNEQCKLTVATDGQGFQYRMMVFKNYNN